MYRQFTISNKRTYWRNVGQTFIALTICLMLLALVQPAIVSAAGQTLSGSATEGNLRITIQDSGQMNVERYASGAWVSQIFAGSSKGSRLQIDGTGYYFGYFNTGTQATNMGYSISGNTATNRWAAGPTSVVQKTTYNDGNAYYRLEWNITNTSSSTLSNLRFFHGEDTYLSGGDNGAGFWDAANNAVGVSKTVSGVQQRLTLQAITVPYAYDSLNYYTVYQNGSNGALSNTIDANESTDNGYALEWRQGSLAPGATWTIIAFEKFNNASVGGLSVTAPVSIECNPGSTCDMIFTVQNQAGSSANVNLSVSGTQSWGQTITSANPVTIPGSSSVQVTVQVTVPPGTPYGSTGNFTLTANDGSGDYSDTGGVTVPIPPYVPPTAFTSGAPASGTFGAAYSHTFVANGTPAPTYAVTSGSLPSGLSLDSSGLLSGTPNAVNTFNFTVTATNAGGSYAQNYSITINKAGSSTTITSDSPDPSVFGQNYTVSASVSSVTSGTPTGSVAVSDGTNTCNITLSGGTGSCVLPSTSVSGKTLTATYNGSVNFNGSSDTESHTVNKANTVTTITSDGPDASVYGQDYTVSVDVSAVAPGAGTPTGSVAVSDGTNNCNITLSSGSGSCALPSTSAGSKTLTATYSGSASFNGSIDTEAHTVIKADTTVAVDRSVVSPVYGEPLHLSAVVSTVAPGTYTPAGTVQFYMDGSPFGAPVTLSTGMADSPVTTSLDAGDHTYYAVYLGDANNNGSNTLPAVTFEINQNSTTATVVSSDGASVYGQPIHLTATVEEVLPSVVTPVGQVQFYVDGAALGSPVSLDASGKAVTADLHTLLPAGHLLVGPHTFSVSYAGNSNTLASDSSVENQTVNLAPTTVQVASSENPTVYGTSLQMTISVIQDSASLVIPAGQVQLFVDGVRFSSPLTLDAAGQAVRTVPYLNLWPGAHTVTAAYTPAAPAQFEASDNNAAPLGQIVQKAAPVFAITPSAAAPVASQPLGYHVVVSPSMVTQGTPSGTVQFYVDGTAVGGSVMLDAMGAADSPLPVMLSSGSHTVTVGYSGDDYFLSIPASPALDQNVAKANAIARLISVAPSASVVGQPVTVTVQVDPVAPATGFPSGTVIVSNGVDNCVASLNASGAGSCQLAPTSPGAPDLSADYSGSTDFNAASAAPLPGPVVSKADLTVGITGFLPVSPVAGQPVTISFSVAPVAPGWGSPTGQVTISDGKGRSCSALISVGSCQITFDEAGPTSLASEYEGDANFNAATFNAVAGPTVQKAASSLLLDSSANPTVYGQPTHFTATVSVVAPGAGSPTGQVQFTIDGAPFGAPVALSNGSAVSQDNATLSVGTHTIGAVYLGDTDFVSSVAANIDQVVNKADTSLSLTSSQNPSPYGIPVLILASVTGNAPSQAIPASGTVQFLVDGINYGAPVPLGADGKASKLLPYTALWVGTHSITAVYSGNSSFNPSDNLASPLQQVVEKGNLTIILTPTVAAPVFGQPFAFTATVLGTGANNPRPTGTVQFAVDGLDLGSPVTLDAASTAVSQVLANLSVGVHSVQLTYSGDDYYSTATVNSAAGVVVAKADTTVSITGFTPDPLVVGQPTTVSFDVMSVAPGAGSPTGTVTISNGLDTCTAMLAVGNCDLKPSVAGNPQLIASYSGDGNFNGSTSSSVDGPVVEPASVSITLNNLSADPIVVGQSYTATFQVDPIAPGTLIPVGMPITISDGAEFCTATIQANGSAACVLTPTSAGTPGLMVTFLGAPNFNDSAAGPFTGPTVNPASTLTNIVSSLNPAVEGGAVHFTATVQTLAPGHGVPSGFVQFQSDGVDLGTKVALVDGAATSPDITTLPVGLHSITAVYSGSNDFATSTSAAISQKIVTGSLSVVVTPGDGETIVYTGVQDGVPITTTIQVPAGAVSDTVTLVYHQFNNSLLAPPENRYFVHSFTLDVYLNGVLQPNFQFNVPLTITMGYNPKNWNANTFEVIGWDGSQWGGEGLNVTNHDPAENSITFTLARTGPLEFALAGEHQFLFWFPVFAK